MPRSPFLITVAVLSAGVSLHATVWTVEEAVATALRQNPDTQAAQHRIEAAQAMITQADSAWMPHLALSSRYMETNTSMQTPA